MIYNKIKGATIARGCSMGELCEALGTLRSTFQRRCEKGKITVKDVKIIREVLGLTDNEVKAIFFEDKLA